MHVDDERGETGVLHGLGVGANDEQAPAGEVGKRGPHLLAVADPLITISDSTRRQPGEVRTRPGLAEQLTPDLFAGEQWAQIARLLRLAPPHRDSGSTHAMPDRVTRNGVRRAFSEYALVDELLQLWVEPEPAVTHRKVNPTETSVELRTEESDRVGALRRKLGQQLGHEIVDQLFVGIEHGFGNSHRVQLQGLVSRSLNGVPPYRDNRNWCQPCSSASSTTSCTSTSPLPHHAG